MKRILVGIVLVMTVGCSGVRPYYDLPGGVVNPFAEDGKKTDGPKGKSIQLALNDFYSAR